MAETEDRERIAKRMARAGVASRRDAERMILFGRVSLNGTLLTTPATLVGPEDVITIDGQPLPEKQAARLWRYHKERGVMTTHRDPEGRPTVFDRLPKTLPRVISVGRLDFNSEGLILLTNDGELANLLAHPRHGVDKEYLATVEGAVGPGAIRRLREGVELDDGVTSPAEVSQPEPGVLRITIHEGRNRQVRRMCEAVGHPVQRLVRVRIGPLRDASLRPGQWRELSAAEVKALSEAAATSG